MMKKVKTIQRPDIAGACVLTAAQLNKYRFSDRHTVLTPELLEKMAKNSKLS